MARLFTGIALPPDICDQLIALQGGVPGARWRPRENLHATLAFIGEVNSHTERDIEDTLERIETPAFDIRLKGTGQFGKGRPHTLWAGIEELGELSHLAGKVVTALKQLGLKIENRKYIPHVTIARLRNARRDDVSAFVASHNGFASDYFHVDRFVLYQSHMGKGVSHYVKNAEYTLATIPPADEKS